MLAITQTAHLSVSLVCAIVAIVLFAIRAFWNPEPARVHLGWLGMAFLALALVL